MTTTMRIPLLAWPGCLFCYNSGRLAGAWIDVSEAGELTIEKLYEPAGVLLLPGCEEIWCLDGDGPWPDFHEMGLAEAQEWADAYADVEPWLWPTLSAWVASGAYVIAVATRTRHHTGNVNLGGKPTAKISIA